MISAQAAISRFRRDLTISALLRGLLLAGAVGCVLSGAIGEGSGMNGALILLGIGALWSVLGYRSIRGSRLAADSPLLIASGRFDEAESRIDAALRSFSLFKPAKFISLHHLAVLRHAQRRWQESALLCRALLNQRLGSLRGISKPSLLLLTDNLLRLGDLTGAYEALGHLYRRRLNLVEALTLQQLQLEYLARIGSFGPMLADVRSRIELAELMPSAHAARAQAFLSLGALKCGRTDLHHWLRGRAELLCDPRTLVAERPVLAEIWPDVIPDQLSAAVATTPEVKAVSAEAGPGAANPEVDPSTDR
jgi:hypothetical protein